MKTFLLLTLLVGLALADDVIEYTDADFNSKIDDHDLILVEFFAPWCGHCKRLAPEYEKAAGVLLREDPPVPLAKVDCIANKETCGQFGVSGYPTLKVFRGGTPSDYNGPRDADGIVKYMKKQAGPSTKELKTLEEVEKFAAQSDPTIVGFFSDAESADKKEFTKTATALFEDFKFGFTTDSAAAEKYGVQDKVILFRPQRLKSKFEESQVVYEGNMKKKNLEPFIRDNVNGICGHMTMDNMDLFNKKPLLVAYYDVDYVKNLKGSNYWRNRVLKVAKGFSDQTLYYAVANADDFRQKLDEYGLDFTEGNGPVVAIDGPNGEKYPMKEKFSVDTLKQFVQQYLDGELEAYLKSEPIPASNDGPVKVVVAKNFNDIVNDENKDVLIEFYAPWCGHCKSLEPKYNELGEKLENDDNIVIAKMDATANDVPQPYSVRGFPTLYWAPKGNKSSPKKYEGGREVDDFLKFIKKEATSKPVKLEKDEL